MWIPRLFLPPWAYARMQLLAQAIEATKSVDDGKLADYFRSNTFKTIIGDVTFGKDGEWAAPRIVWTQFQNIKGSDLKQFEDPATEVVVLPSELKSGTLIWPYSAGGSRVRLSLREAQRRRNPHPGVRALFDGRIASSLRF